MRTTKGTLQGSEVPESEKIPKYRKKTVKIYRTGSSPCTSFSRPHKLLAFRALQNLKSGANVFVDFDNNNQSS